jgi:hypothetical protein
MIDPTLDPPKSIINPYSTTMIHSEVTPLGALEGNCLGKSAVSYVLGGAMGLVMAMFMNAVEMR